MGTDEDRATGLLTLREAARRVGLSRYMVADWIDAGTLPVAAVVDGARRVRPADLDAAFAAASLGGALPAWRRDKRRAGYRLRRLREEAGLTQIQLAARAGLSHEAVSRLELGRAAPLAATVEKLARALGVAPAAFVGAEAAAGAWLTVPEAAARLRVPEDRVRGWLAAGVLAGTKVSGRWRAAAAPVEALRRSGRLRGRSRRLDPRYRG